MSDKTQSGLTEEQELAAISKMSNDNGTSGDETYPDQTPELVSPKFREAE